METVWERLSKHAEFIFEVIKFKIEKCRETNRKWNISIKQFKHSNYINNINMVIENIEVNIDIFNIFIHNNLRILNCIHIILII